MEDLQNPQNLQNKCVVCDDWAAAKHFGRYCCIGCKGFFRRSVRDNRKYVCSFENNCNVQNERRNSCRSCRFRICLEKGLSPDRVRSDHHNDTPRASKTQQCQSHRQSCSSKSEAESPTNSTGSGSGSSEYRAVVPALNAKEFDYRMQARAKIIANNIMQNYFTQNYSYVIPLGAHNVVPMYVKEDLESMLRYYFMVDHILDSFVDTPDSIFDQSFAINVTMGIKEVLHSPGLVCKRTAMHWAPNFISRESHMLQMFGRWFVYLIDWTSHLPHLKEMDQEDLFRLVLYRTTAIAFFIIAEKNRFNTKKCVLTHSGGYMPLGDEIDELETSHLKNLTKTMEPLVWDSFLEVINEMECTKGEVVLLRLISFYTIVPGLSDHGRKVVRTARNYYTSMLARLIEQTYSTLTSLERSERLSQMLLLLPVVDSMVQIQNNAVFMMTIFNNDFANTFIYDYYGLRNGL